MTDLSNLDLSSALAAAETVCTVEVLGELEEEDVIAALTRGKPAEEVGAAITTLSDESADPKDIKKLRAKHHSVARLIASGMTQRMVAQLSGYTEGYLSVLLGSPAMEDLVAIYQKQLGSQHEILAERLRKVADDAVDEIETRLEDPVARQAMDVNELLAIGKFGMDRSGHGPSSTQHNIVEQHTFDHAELRRRDREARLASADRRITPALPAPIKEGENGDG